MIFLPPSSGGNGDWGGLLPLLGRGISSVAVEAGNYGWEHWATGVREHCRTGANYPVITYSSGTVVNHSVDTCKCRTMVNYSVIYLIQ